MHGWGHHGEPALPSDVYTNRSFASWGNPTKRRAKEKLNAAAVSDAPVAEASVADDSAVSADAGSDDASEAPSVEVLPDSAPAVADEPAVVTSV